MQPVKDHLPALFDYPSFYALNAMVSHSDYEDALAKFKITCAGWSRIEMILEILSVRLHPLRITMLC
jgi:hypothetical protein